jgi:hypothetical protein
LVVSYALIAAIAAAGAADAVVVVTGELASLLHAFPARTVVRNVKVPVL